MNTQDDIQADAGASPEVYSPWAAMSLVLVLVSFGGCLVSMGLAYFLTPTAGLAMFALPLIALAAVVTGIIGLRQVNRSGGRVGGRNASMIGVIVGIGLTALQGAVVIGATIFWFAISNNIKPAMQAFADASAQGNWAEVRGMLTTETGEAVSDGRLASFWDSIEPTDDPGARAEASFGVEVLLETREALARGGTSSNQATIDEAMFPVRYTWADGSGSMVYVFADADALQNNSVELVDLLVVVGEGEVVTLLPDGPAKETSEMVGWSVRE